jgi:hypothetical protein
MKTINIDYQMEESSIIGDDSYVPPRIEIIEVTVEKGFADSTSDFIPGTW